MIKSCLAALASAMALPLFAGDVIDVTTGQQIYTGYLARTNVVIARNVSLADVTDVLGFGGGGSTTSPHYLTAKSAYERSGEGYREFQMQFIEPTSVKAVVVRLEQSGSDIVARGRAGYYYSWTVPDNKAALPTDPVNAPHGIEPVYPGYYDLEQADAARNGQGVAESDTEAGYGIHHVVLVTGARTKESLTTPVDGATYNITDGGTLELTGKTDFAGYVDGHGEFKIGNGFVRETTDPVEVLVRYNGEQILLFEKANVHTLKLESTGVAGSAVGNNPKDILICHDVRESEQVRKMQVQFKDGVTLKAALLQLQQSGDSVIAWVYNTKYDKNNEYKLGDDASGWSNGGDYHLVNAVFSAPATCVNLSVTNLGYNAFTVDGAFVNNTSRWILNRAGYLTVRNGGYLDANFKSEKSRSGGDLNIYSGFGATSGGTRAIISVLDGSTLFARGFTIDSDSVLRVEGGSTYAFSSSGYVPYLTLEGGSRVWSYPNQNHALRMGYVQQICKIWSKGTDCTNFVDSCFNFVNSNAGTPNTVQLIVDAPLVFSRQVQKGEKAGARLIKLGPSWVEFRGDSKLDGTTVIEDGTLRIANDLGLTNNVTLAGGTFEIASNTTVVAGALALSSRTYPTAAKGGTISLEPTAALEFRELGDFAEDAQLVIDCGLDERTFNEPVRMPVRMPALTGNQLSAIRCQGVRRMLRVTQDADGYLHAMPAGGLILIFR